MSVTITETCRCGAAATASATTVSDLEQLMKPFYIHREQCTFPLRTVSADRRPRLWTPADPLIIETRDGGSAAFCAEDNGLWSITFTTPDENNQWGEFADEDDATAVSNWLAVRYGPSGFRSAAEPKRGWSVLTRDSDGDTLTFEGVFFSEEKARDAAERSWEPGRTIVVASHLIDEHDSSKIEAFFGEDGWTRASRRAQG